MKNDVVMNCGANSSLGIGKEKAKKRKEAAVEEDGRRKDKPSVCSSQTQSWGCWQNGPGQARPDQTTLHDGKKRTSVTGRAHPSHRSGTLAEDQQQKASRVQCQENWIGWPLTRMSAACSRERASAAVFLWK